MTKQLTAEQALQLIAKVCQVQAANIEKVEVIISNWYQTQPHPTTGNAVQIDKRILVELSGALQQCLDISDKSIMI